MKQAAVVRRVFEPLLTFDKDLKPVPAAASSFDVSADGKTYTFHLRAGAKWSDCGSSRRYAGLTFLSALSVSKH